MKWLFFISIIVLSICALGTNKAYRAIPVMRDTVPQGAPQLFGAKNYEFKNYVLVDSFIMNRGGDTNLIPYWPALKFKRSDLRLYAYDSTAWQRILWARDTVSTLATQYDLTQLPAGTILNNIGSGYRWAATPTGNIKTVAASNTILWDSASNSNALTAKADTSVLATQYDLTQLPATVLSNIGSGFRAVATPTGNIKTFFGNNTITIDSSSNSNALTFKADTSVLATQYDILLAHEQILGILFQNATFSSLAGFTNNGATVSAGSGNLNFSGGSPAAQSLDLDTSTVMEKWAIGGIYIPSVAGNGFGAGVRSNSTGGFNNLYARFNTNTGFMQVYVATTLVATSGSALTFSLGDSIEFTSSRNKTIFIASCRNKTTNSASITVQYNFDLTSPAVFMPNTGRLAIFNDGGSFAVDSICFFSNEVKNPDFIMVGDSKTGGAKASREGFRAVDLMNNNSSTVCLGGPADRCEDYIRRAPEMIRIAGQKTKVIINGESNNIRVGQDSLTYTRLYDSLVTILRTAGLNVYHTTGIYEPGINQNVFRNHIYRKYAADSIIETLPPTQKAGFLDADNIHPNDTGYVNYYNILLASSKLKSNFNTTNERGSTVLHNQSSIYQPSAYRIIGTGEIYNPTIASFANAFKISTVGALAQSISINADHATNQTAWIAFQRQGVTKGWMGLGLNVGSGINDVGIRHDGAAFNIGTSAIADIHITNGNRIYFGGITTTPTGFDYPFIVSSNLQFMQNLNTTHSNGPTLGWSQNGTHIGYIGWGGLALGGFTTHMTFRSETAGIFDWCNGSGVIGMTLNGGELRLGSALATDQGSFSFQNTGGLYQNGTVSLWGATGPPSTYNVLVHGLTDSVVYQVPLSSITGAVTTLYTGDGTLSGNRTVTGGSNSLTVTSTNTAGQNSTLTVNNTSTGRGVTLSTGSGTGVRSVANSGIGVHGISTSNYGLRGESSSSPALYAIANSAAGAQIQTNPTSTNDNKTIIELYRLSQSAGANNISGSIDMYINNAAGAGTTVLANQLISKLPTATSTSETSQLIIKGINGGSQATVATFDANGNATFGTTNSIVGTTGTETATAGNIGEVISSTVSTYTNYTTTATYQNIGSITLSAGDWDISAQGTFSSNGATITGASDAIFVVSTTTASAAGAVEGKNIVYVPQAALLGTSHESVTIAPFDVHPSSSTTYYYNTQATFTLGNPQFVGTIRARRIR